jgi:hypothetical protein
MLKKDGIIICTAMPNIVVIIYLLGTVLCAFFWVISRRLNCMCQRFGTFCLFHLRRQIGIEWLCLRNVGGFKGKQGLAWKWPEPIERRVAQAIFEPILVSIWTPPHFLNIVILHLLRWNRVFRNVGI